jgi:hypothetical protein
MGLALQQLLMAVALLLSLLLAGPTAVLAPPAAPATATEGSAHETQPCVSTATTSSGTSVAVIFQCAHAVSPLRCDLTPYVEKMGRQRQARRQPKKRAMVRHRPPPRPGAQCATPRIATGARQQQSVPRSKSAYGAQ